MLYKHVFMLKQQTSRNPSDSRHLRRVDPFLTLGSGHQMVYQVTHALKKTLSRNPNGVLRWQGAGSARPRNRYRLPGFGSRPQGPRIELSPIQTPCATAAKRRRVGNEAESSTAQKSAPPSSMSSIVFPTSGSTSPTRSTPAINERTLVPPVSAPTLAPAAVVTPKVNGATTPRLRTAGLSVKPTTPAVPSPLRQTWKQNDSPPQPPTRPTRCKLYDGAHSGSHPPQET